MQDLSEGRRIEQSIHSALARYQQERGWRGVEGVEKDSALGLLKAFLDVSHRELRVPPEQLDAAQLEEILLTRLPRRLSAKRKDADRTVDVVLSYYALLEGSADGGVRAELKPVFERASAGFGAVLRGEQAIAAESAPALQRDTEKVGRNDPCPCGSGKKYKKCCGVNT